MSALPLFDQVFAGKPSPGPRLTPEDLKQSGIKSVLSHTPDDYRSRFEEAILGFGTVFTSEDVVNRVGMPPNHENAVGALMNGLARRGLIRKTGQYVKSNRPSRHAAIVALWERK